MTKIQTPIIDGSRAASSLSPNSRTDARAAAKNTGGFGSRPLVNACQRLGRLAAASVLNSSNQSRRRDASRPTAEK